MDISKKEDEDANNNVNDNKLKEDKKE